MITLEPASAADTAEYVRLRGATRENAVSEERLRSLGITADSWAASMDSGQLTGFVARAGDRMVGYGFGDTGTGEVVVLALRPAYEGQGLGRRLLALVVDELRRRGHARAFLGCSADPQVRSYGFYRHLGWRSTGTLDERGDEILELML